MAAQPVLVDMKPRLEAAAVAVRDSKDAYDAAMELRNELVATAVDEGMSQRAVARATGLAISRITSILLEQAGA